MIINRDEEFDNDDNESSYFRLSDEALARHFKIIRPGFKKLVKFLISDKWNQHNAEKAEKKARKNPAAKGWNRWDPITDNIILGAIPDQTIFAQFTNFFKNKKGIVIICVLDDFEIGAEGKIQIEDYEKFKIEHYHMPMTDFGGGGTTKDAVLAAVYQIRQAVLDGKGVYVHCKAGRARSAMVLAAYFAIYPPIDKYGFPLCEQDSLKSAVEFLKLKRPQVDLHDDLLIGHEEAWVKLHTLKPKPKELLQPEELDVSKIGKLRKADEAIRYHIELSIKPDGSRESNKIIPIEKFNQENKEILCQTMRSIPDGKSLLSSMEFKHHVVQMNSFKKLKIAISFLPDGRAFNYANKLLDDIIMATNDDWFEGRKIDQNNMLSKFYYNTKTSPKTKKIIRQFVDEVIEYKKLHHCKEKPLFENSLGKIKEYYMNLHSNSIRATYFKKERKLEVSWEKFNIALEKYRKSLDKMDIDKEKFLKNYTNLLAALSDLEKNIGKRINEEKNKFKLANKKEFIAHFDDYKKEIDKFILELGETAAIVNRQTVSLDSSSDTIIKQNELSIGINSSQEYIFPSEDETTDEESNYSSFNLQKNNN
jgi:hypothetical protein